MPICTRIVSMATVVLLCCPPAALPASAADASPCVARMQGTFPASGSAVIRSGLAWMQEEDPLFRHMRSILAERLEKQGLVVLPVAPSAPAPQPDAATPLEAALPASPPPVRPRTDAASPADIQARTAELARTGKLPKLTLRPYATPQADKDLPPSVLAIAPPDTGMTLFALSQRKGIPVLRGGPKIPGHIPRELASDAQRADYAFLIRFAVVLGPLAAAPSPSWSAREVPRQERLLAAAVGGVGSLGFGPPAPAQPRAAYGTPGGYARGHEGMRANDFWGRDSDFYARDYLFKNSPPPPSATPPSDFAPLSGPARPGQRPVARMPRRAAMTDGLYRLEIDCYRLASLRAGKIPAPLWQATAEQAPDRGGLAAALPDMARALWP